MLEIHENYSEWKPPAWVRKTVERLLESLPSQYLSELRSIVLTDSAMVRRGKTRRVGKRKYHQKECLGFYHHARRDSQGWIELVIDNIVDSYPRQAFVLQVARDIALAETLYHEIGHHLHETVGSAARGGELSAEDWRRKLSKIHGRRRYWYLRLLRPLLVPVRALLRGISKRISEERPAA